MSINGLCFHAFILNNFNHYMRGDEDDEKGLFTFYKEQELQEEQLRARFNKRKKNKKSKRRIKSQLKSIDSSVFVINE